MVVPGAGAVSYERGNPVPEEFITRKPSDESTALGHTISLFLSHTRTHNTKYVFQLSDTQVYEPEIRNTYFS